MLLGQQERAGRLHCRPSPHGVGGNFGPLQRCRRWRARRRCRRRHGVAGMRFACLVSTVVGASGSGRDLMPVALDGRSDGLTPGVLAVVRRRGSLRRCARRKRCAFGCRLRRRLPGSSLLRRRLLRRGLLRSRRRGRPAHSGHVVPFMLGERWRCADGGREQENARFHAALSSSGRIFTTRIMPACIW